MLSLPMPPSEAYDEFNAIAKSYEKRLEKLLKSLKSDNGLIVCFKSLKCFYYYFYFNTALKYKTFKKLKTEAF